MNIPFFSAEYKQRDISFYPNTLYDLKKNAPRRMLDDQTASAVAADLMENNVKGQEMFVRK